MSPRSLALLLGTYATLLLIACLAVRARVSLRAIPEGEQVVVATRWLEGKRLARAVRPATPPGNDGVVVEEIAVAEAPLSSGASLAFAMVGGRDGIASELDGVTAYVTVDDLLAAQAYDTAAAPLDPSLGVGVDRALLLRLLATEHGVAPDDVARRARLRRVRFERRAREDAAPRVTGASLTRARAERAAMDAARYLAGTVEPSGRYRYLVDATRDTTLPGYNWPRHAGATYFLAQAATHFDHASLRDAALRAARVLRDEVTVACGDHACIADDDEATVGASALALLAFAQIAESGLDRSYSFPARRLAAFLRAQQRDDGELMHVYDRAARRPVDVQRMYFTGEAALALGRAHRITGDSADLTAASRALSHLARRGWTFFGSRYYFGEEHWTCQAAAELWDRAPDAAAFDLCLRWHAYQQRLQHDDGDSPYDADGSFGFGPFVSPRVTAASSRGEAAAAALAVLDRDGRALGDRTPETVARLDDELRRAVAFVVRAQLAPGPSHLFARPYAVHGGVPGSLVDLRLRNDYAQHAGSMILGWLAHDAHVARSHGSP